MLGSKEIKGGVELSCIVDFKNVTIAGLESSPVAETLAGLRAHEARYFMNKYKHEFTVVPANESGETLDYVNRILKEERDIEFAAKPLETSRFQVENIKFAYVFYEDGLAVNVMYTLDNPKKRAVGFKLSEGMEIPKELEEKFKFARQKSKLAGTIRGSFFVIKGEYSVS
ncbi:phage tail protein [Bacillus mycoides]|uniref:phage tail protein n=1 Tax=Bacillus mycoides TaxID=1405 RepID=UPI003D0942A2